MIQLKYAKHLTNRSPLYILVFVVCNKWNRLKIILKLDHKFTAIGKSESWLKYVNTERHVYESYNAVHTCRQFCSGGGLYIYIRNYLNTAPEMTCVTKMAQLNPFSLTSTRIILEGTRMPLTGLPTSFMARKCNSMVILPEYRWEIIDIMKSLKHNRPGSDAIRQISQRSLMPASLNPWCILRSFHHTRYLPQRTEAGESRIFTCISSQRSTPWYFLITDLHPLPFSPKYLTQGFYFIKWRLGPWTISRLLLCIRYY